MPLNPRIEDISLGNLDIGHTYSFACYGMCLVLKHSYDERYKPYVLVEQLGKDSMRLTASIIPNKYRVYENNMILNKEE